MNQPEIRSFDGYPPGAQQLIRAAERLFGQRGVDGVTIRELLAEAGQGNKSAVHHYFGSKEGLLQAVHSMRLPALETARARWLDGLPAHSERPHRDLLTALFLPVLEVMDDAELLAYTQFNLRLLHSGVFDQSFMRSVLGTAATKTIVDRLYACFPAIPVPVFKARLRLAVGVFLGGVAEWRLLGANRSRPYPSAEAFWADVILMAAGLLEAPYADVNGFQVTLLRPARRRSAVVTAAPAPRAGRPPRRKAVVTP